MKSLPLLLFLSFSLSAQELYFVDEPTLTPDGSQIIFSYRGDLWRVEAEGGAAQRLTALEGEETNPSVSPDGKWLAFSSGQYGNLDIMLMPLAGGELRQLTYHEADDRVESWSWDSGRVYFTSGRYNRMATYTVEVEGGTPKRLFGDHYFNNQHNAYEHPDGRIFFNESWESRMFVHRKRYRGPYNPDVKSYDPASDRYEQYTDWEGKDMLAVVDREGRVYFLSDRDNDEYNLYRLNGKDAPKRLFKSDNSIYAPAVSADGSRLAYVKDFQLYTYDVGRGRERKVAVTAPGYEELGQLQDYNTKGKVSAFDVAYDGKKLAFVSRGELFVSDMEGKFIRRLETGPGRVGEVQWLKDDLNLLFNQTVDGYQNWFTVAADGSGAAEQHTKDRQNNRALSISNDSSQAVYLSGRNELRIMDLEEFSSKTIANDEIWAIQNTYPRWSPNDDYIAYNARRDFEMDIFLYDVAAGTSENLTRTGVSEWGPYWSPDGKYLYFYGARHQPGYPRGGGDANVYRLPLQRRAEPLRAEGFRKLFAEDSTKTDSVTHIDRKDIMARIEQVGTSFGDQGSVAVVQEKDKQIVLYGGNQVEGKFQLYQTVFEPYEGPTTKAIETKNTGGADDLVMADGKYYLIGDGTVQQLDLDGSKTKAITLDYTFRRRLRPEFEQMFYETWANMEQNFYDTDFHGVDWSALRDAYAEFLPYVNTRADLRRLTNAMLGELNTSHFGFYSSGDEEDVTFGAKSIDLGLTFAPEDPFLIEAIVTEGPADYVDIDLEPGDRLLAIDGQRIDPTRNRESYLSRPSVDGEVELTIDRNGSERTVNLSPASYRSVTGHRYDEWVRENQRRVDERTSENIAYVHMKNMGGGELDNFLNEMVSETYRKNGLILDLRYNTGGNVHDAVLQFLSQRPYLEWKYRGGEPAPQPNFAPAAKPIVLLINEQSLSDAEMTAAGFKQLGLGTVVGMPTYRWIIFTTGQGLVDGSYYRLPSWGCYTLDGRNLEKTGVEPDVRVDNTMLDRLHGRDPQLERAIDEVLRAR